MLSSMQKQLLLLFAMIHLIAIHGKAQDLVKYQRGFTFEQGIYLNFEQFKANKPIPIARIKTMEHLKDRPDYLKQITARREFDYLDENGALQTIRTRNTWGFSTGQSVYVRPDIRIAIVGAICHFTTFYEYYFDPTLGAGAYRTPANFNGQQEVIEYMLDFKTGEINRFSRRNLEVVLQRDPALYEEYKRTRGSKKKRTYLFLNRYNEAHSIAFPSRT